MKFEPQPVVSVSGATPVPVYNEQRLHSSLGYVTPQAMVAGRQAEIHAARDRKLAQARQLRKQTVPSERTQLTLSLKDEAA